MTRWNLPATIVLSTTLVVVAGSWGIARQAPAPGAAQSSTPKANAGGAVASTPSVKAQDASKSAVQAADVPALDPAAAPKPSSLLFYDQESRALAPSHSSTRPTDLAIRLGLARRRVPWSADMLKRKLISSQQHDQALVAVQLLEAEIETHIIDLENEIDLLGVQREARVVEHMMARARMERARVDQRRLHELEKKGPGYATRSEVEIADADVRLMEGHVVAREAGLKEVGLRIAQAKRRLERIKLLAQLAPGQSGDAPPPAAPDLGAPVP